MHKFVRCNPSAEVNIAELALAAFAVANRRSMGTIRDVRRSILLISASPRGHTRTKANLNGACVILQARKYTKKNDRPKWP